MGVSTRRGVRRARSVRWAISLVALAGAGFMASAQAAEQDRALGEVTEALECATGARLGYDVQFDERIGAYAVAGVEVTRVAPQCVGRAVVVSVLDAAGDELAAGRVQLADGAQASFADGALVDAREVMALRVLPG